MSRYTCSGLRGCVKRGAGHLWPIQRADRGAAAHGYDSTVQYCGP